jgi:D-alanyl-D-alanine carboxypeptidase
MKYGFVTALVGAIFFPVAASATELTQVERVQEALDTWLAARAPIEKVTGIAAYVSFGAAGPTISF